MKFHQYNTDIPQIEEIGKDLFKVVLPQPFYAPNNIYILNGFVFVNDGQTLTIEKGTIIKGKAGQGENASALIVAMGGKIMAEGTADLPIIFTAEADDLQGSVPDLDNGLWGGIIILGKANLNTSSVPQQIEGIPTNEPRGAYGGTNDGDDSGILKYVSIWGCC